MIKFFRKIRLNLLSQDKSARYFKYAIGEIILVVIGILIALQVNNWNENRKAKNDEIKLLKNVLLDVKQENKSTQTQIRWFKLYQDANFEIYEQTKDSTLFGPSLKHNNLIWTNYFRPLIKENYGARVSEMDNKIIQELLRDLIWRENLTSEAMQEWNDYKINYVRPFFAKNGINNSASSFGHSRYEFMSLDTIMLLDYDHLKKQYGTIEFDQILYESRQKASWVIHCLNKMKLANEKVDTALNYYINGEIENLEQIKPIDSYY